MIEFKADCGHTVRARDEDAGNVVRCSYCGRNAQVPDSRDSELDFLFRELDQTGEVIPERRRRRKSAKAKDPNRKRWTIGSFDPFAIILKLCYAALLIAIVVVVGRKWILPWFEGPRNVPWTRSFGGAKPDESTAKAEDPARRRGAGPGLLDLRRPDGLYVASTPGGAAAYCLEESRAPGRGRRIFDVAGVQTFRTDGECPRTNDGSYIVEVALPWNDPRLNHYPDYWNFRRAVENASVEKRRSLVEDYFMPDDAIDAFVAQTEEQIYLVRQYHATVRHGRSPGVQALFLPRIRKDDGKTIAVEPLVASILPEKKSYEFNEQHVRDELAYYGVPESDRRFVVEALGRVGAVAYLTPDGRTRLFKIGMHDGVFATKVVRETTE